MEIERGWFMRKLASAYGDNAFWGQLISTLVPGLLSYWISVESNALFSATFGDDVLGDVTVTFLVLLTAFFEKNHFVNS